MPPAAVRTMNKIILSLNAKNYGPYKSGVKLVVGITDKDANIGIYFIF